MKKFLALEEKFSSKVTKLEKGTNQLFKVVFQRLDDLDETLPEHPRDRQKNWD